MGITINIIPAKATQLRIALRCAVCFFASSSNKMVSTSFIVWVFGLTEVIK